MRRASLRQALQTFILANSRRLCVGGFFAALLLTGVLCYRDYGVSWDEFALRNNGMVSAKYVANLLAPEWTARQPKFATVPALHGYRDNDHGVLFEVPLVLAAKVLGVNDSRTYYLLRHLAVFLLYVGGVGALYQLGRIRLRSWGWGLAVSGLLVLSPRFFAESFYNGGDIVFLALFTIGVYTLVRWLERPTLGRAAVHGLATAAAVDVRILGVLLVAFTVGMVALEAGFGSGERASRWALARKLPGYLVVTALAVVAGWPYLWEAPVEHFLFAFERLSRYSAWNGSVLYLGHVVWAHRLPWHYAPVWIFITTPLAYTGAAVLGAGGAAWALVRRPWACLSTREGRLDVLFLGWLGLPLLLVIGLQSVLYDGWRHLYFVYPALLLLAGRGAQALWHARQRGPVLRRLAVALATVAGLELAYTVARMWRAHPQQQVYFSFLPPRAAEQLFEGDYWALSYRAGLEWIARHDPSAVLLVSGQNNSVIEKNLAIINRQDRARFRIVKLAEARYFLSAYRTHPAAYPDSMGREVYRVEAFGRRVLSVLRRPAPR